MPDQAPPSSGRINEGIHYMTARVYYEDTDVNGHIYHANYLKIMERARCEFLRLLDIECSALMWSQSEANMFVVKHVDIDFLGAAKLDDVIRIETETVRLGGASMDMEQRIYLDNDLITKAKLKVAIVNGEGKPQRFAADVKAKLEAGIKTV